jgi:hypothetical protein
MAQRRAAVAPQLRSASAPVYSYLVTAIGAVEQRDVGATSASLTFVGKLAKKDGYSREHLVLVENSAEQPDLVPTVLSQLLTGTPTRMLVAFERQMMPGANGVQRIQAIARIEGIAAAQPDLRQLSLF